jgi:hypothetical protein
MSQTINTPGDACVGRGDRRKTWRRPTIQRLNTNSAEGGPGGAGDSCPNPGSDKGHPCS